MTENEKKEEAFLLKMQDLAKMMREAKTFGEVKRSLVYYSEVMCDFYDDAGMSFETANPLISNIKLDIALLGNRRFSEVDWLHEKNGDPRWFRDWIIDTEPPTVESFFDYWGNLKPDNSENNSRLIEEAQERLDIKIEGLLADVFTYKNGGHTDFKWYPLTANPRYCIKYNNDTIWDEFHSNWEEIEGSNWYFPVQEWMSLKALLEKENDEYDLGDIIDDKERNSSVKGWDQLIVISYFDERDIRELLCLDYRQNPAKPTITFINDLYGEISEGKKLGKFTSFFKSLRREALEELDGVVRVRRNRVVEILDDGKWRNPTHWIPK